MSEDRLIRQLQFLAEVDKLKQVVRRTLLLDASRCENSAEHSYELAVMALVLQEYAPAGTQLSRVLELVLVHDLVEVYAGDTYLFDEAGQAGKAEREARAAERLFGLLPGEQAQQFRTLWDEFEAAETPEARFAAALDRMQPMLHNLQTQGQQWHHYRVPHAQVAANARRVEAGSPRLYAHLAALLEEARQDGRLPERYPP